MMTVIDHLHAFKTAHGVPNQCNRKWYMYMPENGYFHAKCEVPKQLSVSALSCN